MTDPRFSDAKKKQGGERGTSSEQSWMDVFAKQPIEHWRRSSTKRT